MRAVERLQTEARHMGVTQFVREWVTKRLAVERGRPEVTDRFFGQDARNGPSQCCQNRIAARVTLSPGAVGK